MPRLLDEALCPLEGSHETANYPRYYDPLYYPREHTTIFETPKNFVDWLSKTLNSHHLSCMNCDLKFSGCVAFDDSRLKIFHCPYPICLTKSLDYFASADYTHCLLLSDLKVPVDSPFLTVAACMELQMSGLPRWLQYSESVYKCNLSCLKLNSLALSVSKLLAKGKRWSKNDLVTTLLTLFEQAGSSLDGRSATELVDEHSNIELPVGCVRNVLSLLCVHFESQYGSDVAAVLRNPPDPVYTTSRRSCLQKMVSCNFTFIH